MKFFNIEYSKYDHDNRAWINGLFPAIIVLLIFLLFQPFGFRDKNAELKVVLYSGYVFIAYLNSYLNFRIIRHILKKKKKWLLKDELISFIISVFVVTFLVHLFSWKITGDLPLSFQWYFKLLYHVASLFFVIGIIEFNFYNYRTASRNSKHLSSKYETVKHKLEVVKKQDEEFIIVSLEKEQIEINRNKIVYIESVGNYLEFHLCESNGEIYKLIKRGRLHQAEKDLASYAEFFKCHRAFIINLKKAIYLKGNIKNARVIFTDLKDEIPVSRSRYKNLKQQLEKIILS